DSKQSVGRYGGSRNLAADSTHSGGLIWSFICVHLENHYALTVFLYEGKTSLIRSLTQDAKLVAEDRLFATLDVTVHAGVLPCRMTVLYADTVGLIADVPAALIPCFWATLEEICYAVMVWFLCISLDTSFAFILACHLLCSAHRQALFQQCRVNCSEFPYHFHYFLRFVVIFIRWLPFNSLLYLINLNYFKT
ncbi:unnamed protein product, partial [Soboliphyme baturini]|uniref:Transmembrane protein n=1 Tax=Soboliphyme baturini TaxID=241478 RepID=A0A183IAK2_9BILA